MNPCHGLTGGIGSGKSTVARWLGEIGVRIIDTDEISHQLTAQGGAALPAIRQAFGDEFVTADSGLDRVPMRQLIFANPESRLQLQAILHPLILAQARTRAAAATTAPYTVVVVPLLFETGNYRDWLQRVIVVDCPEEAQIRHTIQRSSLDEETVLAIMAQQMGRAERLRLADEIIRNDSDLGALKEQVMQLHRRLLAD